MRKLFFTASLLFFSIIGYTQNELDSLFASLSNKDLYIAPLVGGLNIGAKKSADSQGGVSGQKRLSIVSSLNVDIHVLASKYSAKLVAEKLYPLLADSTKDVYASALLYDLLDNRNLGKLPNMSRKKWIDSGKRSSDLKHWE